MAFERSQDGTLVPLARKGEDGLKHSVDAELGDVDGVFPSPERARAD